MTKKADLMKKVYSLWLEFLRLSKNYKDFCTWKREKEQNPSLELPPRLRKIVFIGPFNIGYSNFGDIFEIGFDDWWKIKRKFLLATKKGRSVSLFKIEMESAIEEFKLEERRDPSLNELKWIIARLVDAPKTVIISVTLTGPETVEDLSLQCARLIRRSRSKFKPYHRWPWKYPTSTRRIEELQRYLEVYRLFLQGHRPFEIANQIKYYSDHESAPRERHRMIQSDTRKAERIIRNAEQGIFPGKY